MVDITDNKFSNDFIEEMIKDNRIPSKRSERSCGFKKENISRSEILACWDNGLSYFIKTNIEHDVLIFLFKLTVMAVSF